VTEVFGVALGVESDTAAMVARQVGLLSLSVLSHTLIQTHAPHTRSHHTSTITTTSDDN
jgi:hypothetical protein